MNVTTCKHCKASFDGGVEIVGRPNARMEALLMKLGSHMNTAHPEHAQMQGVIGASFMGWLFLANYNSTDEGLNLYRDQARWQVHQQTLNARFSDEKLKEHSAELARRFVLMCDEDSCNDIHVDTTQRRIYDILLEAVTSIRDTLEEPNRYAEAKAEQLVS